MKNRTYAGIILITLISLLTNATPVEARTESALVLRDSSSIVETNWIRITHKPVNAKIYAHRFLVRNNRQYSCLNSIWTHESHWRWNANNNDGHRTWGIPQAHPGYKMGKGWKTNPIVQMRWGIHYIKARYGTPCRAWHFWRGHRWY